MPKDDPYFFHQTPETLCTELVKHIPDLTTEDVVFEPFSGEGNFVRAFPDNQNLITTEIQDGTDYKSIDLETTLIDWVISNPPFRLEEPDGEHGGTKRINAFFKLTEYFAGKTNKGVAFLVNSNCLAALTPPRLKKLYEEKNVYIYKIVVCSVKKWRGRYYFIIFKNRFTPEEERYEIKERFDFFDFIEGSF